MSGSPTRCHERGRSNLSFHHAWMQPCILMNSLWLVDWSSGNRSMIDIYFLSLSTRLLTWLFTFLSTVEVTIKSRNAEARTLQSQIEALTMRLEDEQSKKVNVSPLVSPLVKWASSRHLMSVSSCWMYMDFCYFSFLGVGCLVWSASVTWSTFAWSSTGGDAWSELRMYHEAP